MKTIIIANQKGGVGKTTVARHLAFYGHEKGLRVLAVDMDVQGNFTTTFRNMEERNKFPFRKADDANWLVASKLFSEDDGLKPIVSDKEGRMSYVAADMGIVDVERQELETVIRLGQKRFKELGKDYDVCVMDTGPAVSNLLVVALAVGDFAVSPCKPDRDAIAGLGGFFSNVLRVRDINKINPKLAPLGVLPNQVKKDRVFHRDVLKQMRATWKEGVLPVELYERAAIDVAKDWPVWRTERGIEKVGQAAMEMRKVCEHIYRRMGL